MGKTSCTGLHWLGLHPQLIKDEGVETVLLLPKFQQGKNRGAREGKKNSRWSEAGWKHEGNYIVAQVKVERNLEALVLGKVMDVI